MRWTQSVKNPKVARALRKALRDKGGRRTDVVEELLTIGLTVSGYMPDDDAPAAADNHPAANRTADLYDQIAAGAGQLLA